MIKQRIDRKAIEQKLADLDEKIEFIQEPVHHFFEAIEELMDQTKQTDNLDLIQFKLDISTLMERFSNEMVDIHESLLEDFEEFNNDVVSELEKLEEGQQELIKIIVGKIYEALKESNVMAFASTPACVNIGEEVLKAAYHISCLTWKYDTKDKNYMA